MARPKPAPAQKWVSTAGIILLALLAPPAPAQDPDPFTAHVRAAEAAARGGLPLVAAAEYRAAVRLHPADADARFALGGVLEEAGQADAAITQYRALIALRPDNAPAHNALAALLEDRGETAAALAQYRQALALAPSDPRLHFNLAAALGDADRPTQAAAEYRAALRLRPDFAEASRALIRLPRPKRAPTAARKRVRKPLQNGFVFRQEQIPAGPRPTGTQAAAPAQAGPDRPRTPTDARTDERQHQP